MTQCVCVKDGYPVTLDLPQRKVFSCQLVFVLFGDFSLFSVREERQFIFLNFFFFFFSEVHLQGLS